jgi:hypothetical protein
MFVDHELNLENLISFVQERQSHYDNKNKVYFLLKETIK